MHGLKSLCMSNPEIFFSHVRLEKLVHVKSGNLLFACTRQKILACKRQKIQFHMYTSKIPCLSKRKTAASKEAAVSLYYNLPHLAHILEAAFRHATLASGGSASTGALTGMSRSPGMGGCAAGAATTTVTTTSGGDNFFDDALHFQKL